MLVSNNKIKALLSLMDDSDMEVYSIVTDRICQYGTSIIPHLENLWENTIENDLQERIEHLIHHIQYNGLEQDILEWKDSNCRLLDGAILVARFQYPDMNIEELKDKILKLWKTVWLELNDQLTSIEQLHILNSVLYHFYKLEGMTYNFDDEDAFFIHKVLEKRKGNALSNGILFQIIAEQIGLPIQAIHVPNHYLLAFHKKNHPIDFSDKESRLKNILFFIDPTTGNVYNRNDMMAYLKEHKCVDSDRLFEPMNNIEIIAYLFKEVASCFDKQKSNYKKEELLRLSHILLPRN